MITPPDLSWLAGHRAQLRRHVAAAMHPAGGFAWLDSQGGPRLDHDVELWITARMTHVAALSVIEGDESMADALEHGIRAFETVLRDPVHDGWYAAVRGGSPTGSDKRAYEHAFVVLALASATAARHPRAEALFQQALALLDARFWRPDDGLVLDVWNRNWSQLEPYRGVNANMHTVEAMLAAHDVTGDARWLQRAASIVARVVHGFAHAMAFRLPEHFTPGWQPVLEYNRDDPAHPFRPFGVTIGHLFEWARLTLHTQSALGPGAEEWMTTDAVALFDVAVRDGWTVDGVEGFIYTTDFEGAPVVRNRMHWVVTEAIAAAWTLHQATGDRRYLDLYATWWQHALEHLIDPHDGSWRHELAPDNTPISSTWDGRPDVYHAYQATLMPVLDRPASIVGGLTRHTRGGAISRWGAERDVTPRR